MPDFNFRPVSQKELFDIIKELKRSKPLGAQQGYLMGHKRW